MSSSVHPAPTTKGTACVKTQYLKKSKVDDAVTDNEPLLKKRKAAEVDSNIQNIDRSSEGTNNAENIISHESTGEEKQKSFKKRKGQNKNRPKYSTLRADKKDRLCPTLLQEIKCTYGNDCKFSHDIPQYLDSKPPDIGSECYAFRLRGYCPFSFACRYAQSHIKKVDDVYINLKSDQYINMTSDPTVERNRLDKEVMIKLRKKKYDFDLAKKAEKKALRTVADYVKANVQKYSTKISDKDIQDELLLMEKEVSVKDANSKSKTNESSPITPALAVSCENQGQSNIFSKDHPDTSEGKTSELSATLVVSKGTSSHNSLCKHSEPDSEKRLGAFTDEDETRIRKEEKKNVDFRDKLYLAPLTTVGNLPFRRICKQYGAEITCGEMAFATKILQGLPSEWALLKRHESEDLFGVQLCGAFCDSMAKCTQLLNETCSLDFIDINVGCPIDMVYEMGAGSALMRRTNRFQEIVRSMVDISTIPITAKIRTGITASKSTAHQLIPKLQEWGISLVALHGRSREQRYTKMADWSYINDCAKLAYPMPLYGGGDILSFDDYNEARKTSVSGVMIARGALIKPWLFTEIKEQRHWDISSTERLDILKDFTNYGLEHWGSDSQGVETTRRFLLEWLSFLHRYVPVGLLERVPIKINDRPPPYVGRNDLETLMASNNSADWVKISEMLLGKVPEGFFFVPKHRANSYE